MQRLHADLGAHVQLVATTLKALQVGGAVHGAHLGGGAVDLVEGEPQLDLVVEALEQRVAELLEQRDQLAAGPAVVAAHELVGQLVVGERDQRLDALGQAVVEDLVVEGETRLVGLLLQARRADAGPVHGGAEHVEAHLGKEVDVLLVVMVKVDGLMARVELVGPDVDGDPLLLVEHATDAVVNHAVALAVHVPGALELVGRARATPQKVVPQHSHGLFPPQRLTYFFEYRREFCA